MKGLVLGAIRAIGLMSGTSLDGVDVALIETDGERFTQQDLLAVRIEPVAGRRKNSFMKRWKA